ncbi:MAG: hypothetical protein ABJL54_10650 [Halioglobus sp.]
MKRHLVLAFTLLCLSYAAQAELEPDAAELQEVRVMGRCGAAYWFIEFHERHREIEDKAKAIALSASSKAEAFQVGDNYGSFFMETQTKLIFIETENGTKEAEALDIIKEYKCNSL